MFGMVGYLFLSNVGGYLYDHVDKKMPYVLYEIMMGISLIFIFIAHMRLKMKGDPNA